MKSCFQKPTGTGREIEIARENGISLAGYAPAARLRPRMSLLQPLRTELRLRAINTWRITATTALIERFGSLGTVSQQRPD